MWYCQLKSIGGSPYCCVKASILILQSSGITNPPTSHEPVEFHLGSILLFSSQQPSDNSFILHSLNSVSQSQNTIPRQGFAPCCDHRIVAFIIVTLADSRSLTKYAYSATRYNAQDRIRTYKAKPNPLDVFFPFQQGANS